MLAAALSRLAGLGRASHRPSPLEALAAAIAEKTDDLLWRTACTLSGRRDLLDLPPHLRRMLMCAARCDASSAALINTTRRANSSRVSSIDFHSQRFESPDFEGADLRVANIGRLRNNTSCPN